MQRNKGGFYDAMEPNKQTQTDADAAAAAFAGANTTLPRSASRVKLHTLSAQTQLVGEHVVVQMLDGIAICNGARPLCPLNCSQTHVNTASLPSLLDTPMWSPENKVLEGLYSSTTEPSVWPGV